MRRFRERRRTHVADFRRGRSPRATGTRASDERDSALSIPHFMAYSSLLRGAPQDREQLAEARGDEYLLFFGTYGATMGDGFILYAVAAARRRRHAGAARFSFATSSQAAFQDTETGAGFARKSPRRRSSPRAGSMRAFEMRAPPLRRRAGGRTMPRVILRAFDASRLLSRLLAEARDILRRYFRGVYEIGWVFPMSAHH